MRLNTESEIDATVKEVLSDVLKIDESTITVDTDFRKDLKIDSLDMIDFALGLQTRFDIEISDQEIEQLDTLGSVITLIERIQLRRTGPEPSLIA